jgi:hypothetical protein
VGANIEDTYGVAPPPHRDVRPRGLGVGKPQVAFVTATDTILATVFGEP